MYPQRQVPLTQRSMNCGKHPLTLSVEICSNGPAFPIAPPSPDETFAFQSQKTKGFSPGHDVKDAAGREWSVKLGSEAQTEVVASRLLWAIGYHQPPVYYVDRWTLDRGPSPGAQAGARFRPKYIIESEVVAQPVR